MKKIAVMQLSSCFGCQQSFLDASEELIPIFQKLDIVYWPTLTDYKIESLINRIDGEIDIGLVEGPIRTEKDLENVKIMREKCETLIAYGTCAGCGGIMGLANQWSKEDLLKNKFNEQIGLGDNNQLIPTENLPEINRSLQVMDKHVKVNAYVIGCPPRTENILGMFDYFLGERNFTQNENNICSVCNLRKTGCFLESDKLCFGPITSIGCSIKCINENNPCVGCYGPSKTIDEQAEKLKELTTNLDSISSDDKRLLNEFFALFFDFPLMGAFDLVGPINPHSDLNPTILEISENVSKFLREVRQPKFMKLTSDFHNISSVCDHCSRIKGKATMTRVKRDFEGLPNLEECLLEQGYICLGPVSKAGCGAQCINVNVPCLGCTTPTLWGMKPKGRYLINRFAEVAIKDFNIDLTKAELLSQIEDHEGNFERFILLRNPHYREGKFKGLTGEWWLEDTITNKTKKTEVGK
ncbi:MAG: hypothetical protein GY870_04795 [archaeon]|nr:hypothetical protein [archaeon]